MVWVSFEGGGDQLNQAMLVEPEGTIMERAGLTVDDAVITLQEDGCARLVVTNCTGFTQSFPEGTCIGC